MEFRWVRQGCAFHCPQRFVADSMETVMGAMSYDAMVTVVGCDKNCRVQWQCCD